MIVFLVILIITAAIVSAWMLIAGAAPGESERRINDEEQMKACHIMEEAHKKGFMRRNK